MVTQHKEPDLQPILTAFPSKRTDSKASRDPLRYSVFNVSLSYSNRVYCPDCALLLEICEHVQWTSNRISPPPWAYVGSSVRRFNRIKKEETPS